MAKSLLSLLLMLTQLLSWSMSSVYLCVDSHGAVCLDGGAESCDCCQHECHQDHDGLCSHDVCHEQHEHGVPAGSSDSPAGWTPADADCDCSHIQIVSQQQPTSVQATVSIDVAHQDFVTPFADGLSATYSALGQIEPADSPLRAASSFALIERASVCLRC